MSSISYNNEISSNLITQNDKIKIQKKIELLKNKNYYKNIFKFIVKENISYSENTNGIFFNLNSLSNKQILHLQKIVESFSTIDKQLEEKSNLDKTYDEYITNN